VGKSFPAPRYRIVAAGAGRLISRPPAIPRRAACGPPIPVCGGRGGRVNIGGHPPDGGKYWRGYIVYSPPWGRPFFGLWYFSCALLLPLFLVVGHLHSGAK